MDYKEVLEEFMPENEFFVGIDSDGCVFPTMELKHKECFIPNIIKYWNLQSISKYAREVAEWVNLYSIYRGINRFPGLVKTIELLSERKEIKKRNVKLPDLSDLKKFVESGLPLSNDGLKEYLKKYPSEVLQRALEWSESVNRCIKEMVKGVRPFPYVRESLKRLNLGADLIVISSTPIESLKREWREHGLDTYIKIIAGQEMGKKKEHLEKTAKGRYKKNHILVIGDAPGDHRAAQSVDGLFFPIKPGCEEESWEEFYKVGIEKFLSEKFAGDYQKKLLEDFYKLLPDTPPWKK